VTDSTAETTGEDSTSETTSTEESSEKQEDSQPVAQEEAPADQPEETAPPAPARVYQDGTFTASAYGYDGDITVHVTIQDDRITDITAETEESDETYFFDAKGVVIPSIIQNQSADADACSAHSLVEAIRLVAQLSQAEAGVSGVRARHLRPRRRAEGIEHRASGKEQEKSK
jgi:uncharacterized protein with FMN-binding domain